MLRTGWASVPGRGRERRQRHHLGRARARRGPRRARPARGLRRHRHRRRHRLRRSARRGGTGCAVEIGHTKVGWDESALPCAVRAKGCVEAYVGGDLAAAAGPRRAGRRRALGGGRPRRAPEEVNPGHLDAAAAEGDEYALELWREVAPLLGVALANAVTMLNPARLILGGGVLSRTPVLRDIIAALEWRSTHRHRGPRHRRRRARRRRRPGRQRTARPGVMTTGWWQSFFDDDYVRLWGVRDAVAPAEVDGIWAMLGLAAGSRLLDAPCGYGRLTRPLAERGARVLGVDQSAALLAEAERGRGDLPADRLTYLQHDLRARSRRRGHRRVRRGDQRLLVARLRQRRGRPGVRAHPGGRRAPRRPGAGRDHAPRPGGGASLARRPGRRAAHGRRHPGGRGGPLRIRSPVGSTPPGTGPVRPARAPSRRRCASTPPPSWSRSSRPPGCASDPAHRGCSPQPFAFDVPDAGGRLALVAERP